MGSIYTPTATWNPTITIPSDSTDLLEVGSVNPAFQAIADNAQWWHDGLVIAQGQIATLTGDLPDYRRVGVRTYTADAGDNTETGLLNSVTAPAWASAPYWLPNPPVTSMPCAVGALSLDVIQFTAALVFVTDTIGTAITLLHSARIVMTPDGGTTILAPTSAITRNEIYFAGVGNVRWMSTIVANAPLGSLTTGSSLQFGIQQRLDTLEGSGSGEAKLYSPLTFRAELYRPVTTP